MDDLLNKLENQYHQIDFLLRNLSSDFIQERHRLEKWSIHEHLAHLGRYHEIFLERIEKIIELESPKFGRYSAEKDEFYQPWVELNTSSILKQTKELRSTIFIKIKELDEEAIQRKGEHPKLGNINIEEWVAFFLLHETHHFYTIFWLVFENRK